MENLKFSAYQDQLTKHAIFTAYSKDKMNSWVRCSLTWTLLLFSGPLLLYKVITGMSLLTHLWN